MIPLLFEANEAIKSNAFKTLGLGPLGDAISCVVTEEKNDSYELKMTYPVEGIHFNDILVDRLILAKPNQTSENQIFRIYEVEAPLGGQVTVYAEHISYLLTKAVVLPISAAGASSAFSEITSNVQWQSDNTNFPTFPFSFWTDSTSSGTCYSEKPCSVRAVLGGQDGSVLDAFGGDYEFDNFTVKLHSSRGADNNVYLRYGKNITDLTKEDDISNVYTGIVPYWQGSITRQATEEELSTAGVVVDDDTSYYDTTVTEDKTVYVDGTVLWSDYTGNYAYPLAKAVDFSSDINTNDIKEEKEAAAEEAGTYSEDTDYNATEDEIREKLTTLAQEYLTNNTGWEPSNSLEVSFVDLWETEQYKDIAAIERVGMGDTVHVIYPKLNITSTMRVVKTEYNVLLDRYDKIELGEAKSSLAKTVVSDNKTTTEKIESVESDLKQAITKATAAISGELGGYVVFNRNSAGGINEILIMDSPTKATATNVWRWNLGGLAHSSNGYNGPFEDFAITADGQLNASAITTGVLSAIKIQTASTGNRIVIENGSASIKGYSGNTLYNVVDMFNSTTGPMVIDAKNSLAIRTPKVLLEAASHGTASSTTREAVTGTNGVVLHCEKYYNTNNVKNNSAYETYESDELGHLFTYPVYLSVTYGDLINGMVASKTTSYVSII